MSEIQAQKRRILAIVYSFTQSFEAIFSGLGLTAGSNVIVCFSPLTGSFVCPLLVNGEGHEPGGGQGQQAHYCPSAATTPASAQVRAAVCQTSSSIFRCLPSAAEMS